MSDEFNTDPDIFIRYQIKTRLVRMINGDLMPSNFKIMAELTPHEDATDMDIEMTVHKISTWVEEYLNDSVIFCVSNENALEMFFHQGNQRCANNFVMSPHEPTDPVIMALLMAKFNAFANDKITFDVIELESDNARGLSFARVGDLEDLPTDKEWLPTRTWFDKAWWNRDDLTSVDSSAPEDADLSVFPEWVVGFHDMGSSKANVVTGTFTPMVLDGGTDPEDPSV